MCLEQIVSSTDRETSIVKCVLTDRVLNRMRQGFLHIMLREIGLVIEEGKRPLVLRRLVL